MKKDLLGNKFLAKRSVSLLLALALAGSFLTGCGAAGNMSSDTAASGMTVTNNTAAMDKGGGFAYDMAEVAVEQEMAVADNAAWDTAASSETGSQAQNPDSMTLLEEKLVYHCNLEIETLDYPATIASVKAAISKYGGVIQSESESDSGYNWYYEDYRKTGGTMRNDLAVRIPSKDYDSFLSELDGVGKVISKSTSVDNISQQYYDTTAQIEALQIQEKNLLAMLEKCETIEDMITVEQRLSEVQYELNSLQNSRRYMDMDVAYSYVNINISEVMEYRQDDEPVRTNTFFDRLKNTVRSTGRGFLSFLEGLLFLIIRLSPYIVIVIVVCFVFFRKKIRQFMEDRKAEKAERYARRMFRQQPGIQPPVMPYEPAEQPAPQETVQQSPDGQDAPEQK